MLLVEINLTPDWTVFIQLGVFFAAIAVLNFFIFKPILRILDRRKAYTLDSFALAQRLTSEATTADKTVADTMSYAINEANKACKQKISHTLLEAEKRILNSKAEAKKILDSTEISVETSQEKVAGEMAKKSDELADIIVSRVLQ